MSEGLTAALHYVQEFNWYVVPLWWVKEDGSCSCRKGTACGRSAGKHPITPNGINDSTQNIEIINRWYEQYPEAGVAADLKRSNLVLLGPDSVEWQEKFEEKGLNIGGATIDTGGGPGHLHYIHRRPPSMPIGRINRSGEFDLMTEGVLPLPPSRHYSGKPRTWVVPPDRWMADAPPLTQQMMVVQKETQSLVTGELSESAYAEPPIKLSPQGESWWEGSNWSQHPDGSPDNSQTMQVMAYYLAEAGASVRLIAETMHEWAVRWGYRKYEDRTDSFKYYIKMAEKAVSEVRPPEPEVEGAEELKIYTLSELLGLTFPKPPMFVDPLIPATGITLVAGASGSLKTAVIADLFLAIFQKRKWLGFYDVPKVSKVLYLDGEIGHQALQIRLKSMGATPSEDLHYIYRSWRIENDKEFKSLLDLAREGGYELILIDSISAMHNLEERTDTTVLVMKRLRQLADVCNCPLLVLANFNKSTNEKRELLERISGPSVYRNKSTAIITLRRFGGKRVMKSRMQLQKNWFGQEGEARTLELKEQDGILQFTSEHWDPPHDDDSGEDQVTEDPSALASLELELYLMTVSSDETILVTSLEKRLASIKGVSAELAKQTVNAAVVDGKLAEPERKGRGGAFVTYRRL